MINQLKFQDVTYAASPPQYIPSQSTEIDTMTSQENHIQAWKPSVKPHRNLSDFFKIDRSSIFPNVELKNYTSLIEGVSEKTTVIEGMLEFDIVIRMPPIKEWPARLREIIIEKATPIVNVRGHPELKMKLSKKTLKNVRFIKPIEEWELNKIQLGPYDLKLKEPLKASLDFIDEKIVLENDKYKLLAIADDWDEALSQLQEQFVFLWEEFTQASDKELSEEGIIFKNKLLKQVEEPK